MGMNIFGEMCVLPKRLMVGVHRNHGPETRGAICPKFW